MNDSDETTRLVRWEPVHASGQSFDRTTVRTGWLQPGDDLATVLRDALRQVARPGDIAFLSEKVVILVTERTVPISQVRPTRLAHFLAHHVRPRAGSRGLAVPEKMQYVLDRAGSVRVLAAAVVSAVTRPLGWHGPFYRIVGPLARDIDGGRPPYDDLLFPPLDAEDARQVADDLETALDMPVAIIDLNDYGGSIRAVSRSALPPGQLEELLRGNPLGQRSRGTPLGILRPR